MATLAAPRSSWDHGITAATIIRHALLLCGALDEDEDASGAATTDGLTALNNLLKTWSQDMHLWTRREVTLFLEADQNEYLLGPASTDAHWAETWYSTTLNGAVTASTSIVVDANTNMTQGDFIGIEQSDGTRAWRTISTINSTTIVLSAAVTAADGATVFFYTSRPQRPLRVVHARRAPYDGSDVPIEIEALNEYFDTPNKTSTGTVVFVAYKATLISGTLYVWQRPRNANQVVKMTIEYPLSDVDEASDFPDLPQEWYEAVVYNLAVRLEPTYRQLDQLRVQALRADAAVFLEAARNFDDDLGSIRLQPRQRH